MERVVAALESDQGVIGGAGEAQKS